MFRDVSLGSRFSLGMTDSVAERVNVGVGLRLVLSSVKTLSSVRLASWAGSLSTAAPGFGGLIEAEAIFLRVGRAEECGTGPPSFLQSVLDKSGRRAV